jgi:hypothetical protein
MNTQDQEPTTAELFARIKDLEEGLGNALIVRRLERAQAALLRAEMRLLQDTELRLRQALDGARGAETPKRRR